MRWFADRRFGPGWGVIDDEDPIAVVTDTAEVVMGVCPALPVAGVVVLPVVVEVMEGAVSTTFA